MSHSLSTRVCVTGGAGFIGSKLVRRLLDEGMRVTVLDNLSVGRRENVPGAARFIEGDILNPRDCEEALDGCEAVCHLAARVAVRSSFEFIVEDTLCNVTGTATVLRAAAKSASIRTVIATSTMAVYLDSPTPTPIAETHPVIPCSPYGASKLAVEHITHLMAAAAGLRSVVLRLFNTYGPGQALSPYVGVITIFEHHLRAGRAPTIFGDGLQIRDFVHVEDVVSGFLAALRSDVTGETINIGSGEPRTVLEVFETLARVFDSPIRPVHAPAVPGELRNVLASIDKARRLLGYAPRHRFEDAIGDVIAEMGRIGAVA
jgi:UDP-glucose 4-epimerase